ncbi:hypothetical protein Hanom_Chr14g01261851 [Helianthus anomalus]
MAFKYILVKIIVPNTIFRINNQALKAYENHVLRTKQENTTQKTSLMGERAHLVYKPHISCPYNRCETSLIPCNGISP